MESGIYHEHKTSIVFGGKIGLVSGTHEDGTICILISELGKAYKKGEAVSDEDAQHSIKNAEVCMFFPTVDDIITFRNFVNSACNDVVRYEKEEEK